MSRWTDTLTKVLSIEGDTARIEVTTQDWYERETYQCFDPPELRGESVEIKAVPVTDELRRKYETQLAETQQKEG